MVFSSTIFLFLFLPMVLLGNAFLPKNLRNSFILFTSLFFYAWGEVELVYVMITSISINYLFGIIIDKTTNNRSLSLLIGVVLNITILFYYKYFNFLLDNINGIMDLKGEQALHIEGLHLPIGISFFTFQGISYIVDVYRKEAKAQINPVNIGLYISLFPQLIAGPIVRYNTVMDQIQNRSTKLTGIFYGIKRFAIGFSKKIIIANTLAQVADDIFNGSYDHISVETAWLGIICYSLQIFFDFSGYSDMAIGLGKILGFDFEENFNFPYIAKSIKEFWRRWHISLSSWFRDYLYIPLGGSRKGNTRTYVNLFIVFLCTGFWHGASWSFIFWGLFHGAFLMLERAGFDKLLEKSYKPIQHFYTLILVIVGWVFFRVEEFGDALTYLARMFGISKKTKDFVWLDYMNNYQTLILVIGLIFCLNIPKGWTWLENKTGEFTKHKLYIEIKTWSTLAIILLLFFFSSSEIANNTYNPFIYFRF